MYGIITGGTRGLGFDAAEELAKDGYTHLILTYNSNTERATKSKKVLEEKYGISVFLVKGDLVQPEAVDAIFECVEKNFGNKLNTLVHNAGAAIGVTSIAETDEAKKAAASYKKTIGSGEFDDFSAYDYFQDIYPKCFIRMVERSIKIMEDGKGYILAISTYGSNCIQTPKPGYAITAQAKGGLELLVSNVKSGMLKIRDLCLISSLELEAFIILKVFFKNKHHIRIRADFTEDLCMRNKKTEACKVGLERAFLC